MAIPDPLLLTGALVGLGGGLVGIATGGATLWDRHKRIAQQKRDAEMVLDVEFQRPHDFANQNVAGEGYPIANAFIFNNGKVPAKAIRAESSTGQASIDTETIYPDQRAVITFAVVDVHQVPNGQFTKWLPSERPYVVGPVTVTVTWRLDGKTARSEPLMWTGDYGTPPLF